MRHLTAEQSRDLGSLGLHLERLEIVRRADEVELGRKLVGGAVVAVEPVAGEDGRASVGGESRELLLQGDEVAVHRRTGSLREIDRVSGVRVKRVERVDVVERGKVVEPQDVAVEELGALDRDCG